ncbi:MAG: hypothetical protein WCD57_25820, partial [Acidobacteriaceae bacterium]
MATVEANFGLGIGFQWSETADPSACLPMYKMLNHIESTADLGRVLFIGFMTSPQARSPAWDDKGMSD